jgi:hypothetical protein
MAVIVMWTFIYNFLEPPESNDKKHQLYEMLNVSPREPLGSHTLDIDSNPGMAAEKSSLAAGVENGAESVPAGLGGVSGVEHGLGGGSGFESGPGRRKLISAALSGGDSLPVQSGGWWEHWRLCTSWLSQQKWEKMVTPPVCGVVSASPRPPLFLKFCGCKATDILRCQPRLRKLTPFWILAFWGC